MLTTPGKKGKVTGKARETEKEKAKTEKAKAKANQERTILMKPRIRTKKTRQQLRRERSAVFTLTEMALVPEGISVHMLMCPQKIQVHQ